jgi:hypothetical protein
VFKAKLDELSSAPWDLIILCFKRLTPGDGPIHPKGSRISAMELERLSQFLPSIQKEPFLVVVLMASSSKACSIVRKSTGFSKDRVLGMSRDAFFSFCGLFRFPGW